MAKETTWDEALRSLTARARLTVQEALNTAMLEELKREDKSMETVHALDRMQKRVMTLVREALDMK